jgi:hypothetical protein
MTNESVLQKLINIINKEREANKNLNQYNKYNQSISAGYTAALGFIRDRIIDMQKDLHNERIESITVDMQHEILHAYDNGFQNARNELMNKLHSIEDLIPYSDDAAMEYYNKRFVFKK